MPSVKIPKKSTNVDMTPFVDVAFLILTFFIMATKFKPAEIVPITTPKSVSTREIDENANAVLITIDKTGKVYFAAQAQKDQALINDLITKVNTERNLGMSPAEIDNFRKTPMIGVPIANLKQLLSYPPDQQKNIQQPGIPLDTLGGELSYWIQTAKAAFEGKKLIYMIKGDNDSKYPVFRDVINALRKNDVYKYNLVTSMKDAPAGSELEKKRARGQKD
jgi:biopolymer transport protein ExbD